MGVQRINNRLSPPYPDDKKGLSPLILMRKEATPSTIPNMSSTDASGGERILFVDDEPMLTHLAMLALGKHGYVVTVETSANSALEIFSTDPGQFDLVITDQGMPEMTGLELSGRIMAIAPATPVILCTGYSGRISEEELKQHGIREYALKPLSMETLASLIRSTLDNAKIIRPSADSP